MEKNTTIQIRVSKEWLAKLDEWRDSQPAKPTRTAVLMAGAEKLMGENAGKKAKR